MNRTVTECAEGEFLVDYAEGVLSADRRAALDRHLAGCRECASELEAIRELKREVASLRSLQPSAAGLDSLLEAAQKTTRSATRTAASRIPALKWAVPAASALAAAAVVLLVSRPAGVAPDSAIRPTDPVSTSSPQGPVGSTELPPPSHAEPVAAPVNAEAAAPHQPTEAPKVAAAERRTTRPAGEPAMRTAPPPTRDPDPEPPPRRSTGNKVEDDFDKIFGSSGGGSAEPAPAPAKKKADVYIPPAPGQGAGAKPGPLGQGDIMEVVLGSRGAIKKCTDEQKASNPDGSGVITMKWIIRNDGGVSNIQTDTAEFQRTPLSQCLTGVIEGFKFPPYTGAQMQPIKFPFKF